MKTLLITGASTGLGAALARMARDAGWSVTATMRDTSKAKDLDGCHVAAMDVTDPASVTACVDDMIARQGRIDALIANAGVGFARNIEQSEEADWQWVMDTNVMGVMRCTRAVLPHMRKARAGHVMVVSSVGGLAGQPFNEVYCASKFAVEGFVEGLASYVSPVFGVNFTALEPGGIRSEFAASAMKQIEQSGGMLDDEYLPILQAYVAGSQARTQNGDASIYQTAEEVAEVALSVLGTKNPPIRLRSSTWGEAFTSLKTEADPTGTKLRDHVVEAMLGDVSRLRKT